VPTPNDMLTAGLMKLAEGITTIALEQRKTNELLGELIDELGGDDEDDDSGSNSEDGGDPLAKLDEWKTRLDSFRKTKKEG